MNVNVAEENIEARVGGTLLMPLSNKIVSLVLTTGYESKTAIGYCIFYGDMSRGFAVIKNITKTLVCNLRAHQNRIKPIFQSEF